MPESRQNHWPWHASLEWSESLVCREHSVSLAYAQATTLGQSLPPLDTIHREGELNEQCNWTRPVVEEGTRSLDKGTPRNWCCASSFWQCIRKRNRHQKGHGISSGADGGCTKGTVGQGSGNGEGCFNTRQTDSLGGRPQEDCRCTKGEMGEGEGREEIGLVTELTIASVV